MNHSPAMAMATSVRMGRKGGMLVPGFTVRSTTPTITSSTTGISSDFTTTTQCWCALRIRFSPGSSSEGIAAPTLSHLEEDDQRAQGQKRTVSQAPFHRSPPDDQPNREESGREHTQEQRIDRAQRTQPKNQQ